jgi:Alternative oxidase
MEDIKIAHRQTRNWSDKVALNMVRFLRYATDTATGYRHDPKIADGTKSADDATSGSKTSSAGLAQKYFQMNERKWLIRFIFLVRLFPNRSF